MSITMTEDGINIAPYKRLCVVCQQEGELVNIYYKYVCVKCIQKLVVSLDVMFGVAVFICDCDASDDKRFMYVHAAADRINDFYCSCHRIPLFNWI